MKAALMSKKNRSVKKLTKKAISNTTGTYSYWLS